MWWHYLIWVPIVIVYYSVFSWLSKQNNEFGGKWLWIMYVYGIVWPGWIVISRISKRLLFDGMLYDNIMFLTYVGTMIYLGAHAKLSMHQWLGVALVVIGSILMRIETAQ
jgi:hypothetical protein